MYLVIRCPGCRTFTYVDPYQHWKLCPVCGEVIDATRVPVYLEAEDHRDADEIIRKLEIYLNETGQDDFTDDEKMQLRSEYARWVRSRMA